MKIKIITDSVSDIPRKIQKELNIDVVPLSVNFGNDTYYDGVDLTNEEFFRKLKNADKLPTTSQVSPGEFKNVFEENLKEYDQIICITMSKKMSGTFEAAGIAKELLNTDDIKIIDSKAISFGYGLIVIDAARNVQNGLEYNEIIKNINYNVENLVNLFIVDTLEYLQKGGRLSATEAIIGNVLKIKPILTIKEGKLTSMDKVRGRKKAMNYIIEYLEYNKYDFKNKTVGFFHAEDEKYLENFISEINEKNQIGEILKSEVGTVVGTHSGPGCIAITFIK
ncbi:DegV family protein [Clostridiaceae bacterium HSG29]|nr:DegV family protein [Clostridiaceae bacterium HSG29]